MELHGICRLLHFFFLTHVIWDPVKENLNAKGPCVRTHADTYVPRHTLRHAAHTRTYTETHTRSLLKSRQGIFNDDQHRRENRIQFFARAEF